MPAAFIFPEAYVPIEAVPRFLFLRTTSGSGRFRLSLVEHPCACDVASPVVFVVREEQNVDRYLPIGEVNDDTFGGGVHVRGDNRQYVGVVECRGRA